MVGQHWPNWIRKKKFGFFDEMKTIRSILWMLLLVLVRFSCNRWKSFDIWVSFIRAYKNRTWKNFDLSKNICLGEMWLELQLLEMNHILRLFFDDVTNTPFLVATCCCNTLMKVLLASAESYLNIPRILCCNCLSEVKPFFLLKLKNS